MTCKSLECKEDFHLIFHNVTCFSESIWWIWHIRLFSLSFFLNAHYVVCVSWLLCSTVVLKLLWREWRRSIIMKSKLHQQPTHSSCEPVCVCERASCEISTQNILTQSGMALCSWMLWTKKVYYLTGFKSLFQQEHDFVVRSTVILAVIIHYDFVTQSWLKKTLRKDESFYISIYISVCILLAMSFGCETKSN